MLLASVAYFSALLASDSNRTVSCKKLRERERVKAAAVFEPGIDSQAKESSRLNTALNPSLNNNDNERYVLLEETLFIQANTTSFAR